MSAMQKMKLIQTRGAHLFRLSVAKVRRLPGIIQLAYRNTSGWIVSFFQELQTNARLRMLTFLWSTVAVFLGVCILSASNPLKLLIPGLAYPIPHFDQRKALPMQLISAENGQVVSTTKWILWSDKTEKNINEIAFLLSRPPSLRDKNAIDAVAYEVLPPLGLAIRKIWIRSAGNVVIDLREKTLFAETDNFMKSRSLPPQKDRNYFLDAFLLAFTKSIQSAVPEVKTIRYTVDGQNVKSFKGMKFDLAAEYSR